jgi:Pentapeptide repeats (8 copies)
MAIVRHRTRPEPWQKHREQAKYRWLVPLFGTEWIFLWIAYWLSGWAFLEVLESLGTLSLLVAVISYFSESGDRIKQKHYHAWEVINSAQGKGGSGGRIDALEELLADRVPLVGVDVSEAFLQEINLSGANLLRANFRTADVRGGNFAKAQLEYADLTSANFRGANLGNTNFGNADLQDADLTGADLRGADFDGANLARADLRHSDLGNIKWKEIANLKAANLFGTKNASPEFVDWAIKKGAVMLESDDEWLALIKGSSE